MQFRFFFVQAGKVKKKNTYIKHEKIYQEVFAPLKIEVRRACARITGWASGTRVFFTLLALPDVAVSAFTRPCLFSLSKS